MSCRMWWQDYCDVITEPFFCDVTIVTKCNLEYPEQTNEFCALVCDTGLAKHEPDSLGTDLNFDLLQITHPTQSVRQCNTTKGVITS